MKLDHPKRNRLVVRMFMWPRLLAWLCLPAAVRSGFSKMASETLSAVWTLVPRALDTCVCVDVYVYIHTHISSHSCLFNTTTAVSYVTRYCICKW